MEKTLKKTAVNLCPTEIVILVLGLIFIKYRLQKISRNAVHKGFKILAEHYPDYFKDFFFSKKGKKRTMAFARTRKYLVSLRRII